MNIANGPVRPTPGNLHPPIDYCIQLTLPNDREWIGAFYDALYQLTYWFAWQRDDDHTGKDIAATWLSVLANMRTCKAAPSPDGCCDGGEPLYRQNPDNPCILESSADGVHWCTLFDVSLCTPATGQPGGGAEQPAIDGGEVCYHLNTPAAYQVYVPTVVNAGDVLTFSNFGGAANDGVPPRWDCPDGKAFLAGICADGTQGASGSDPMPSAPHMSLIAQINGTWYSALSPITVPAGVVNSPILVQLNDVTLGDNQGQWACDVCVQNNQGATGYTHTFAFVYGPLGWLVLGSFSAGWGAGAFQGILTVSAYENRIYLDIPGITNINAFGFRVNVEFVTSHGVVLSAYTALGGTGTQTVLYDQGLPNDSPLNQAYTHSPASITLPGGTNSLVLECTGNILADYNQILEITFSGPGADPF